MCWGHIGRQAKSETAKANAVIGNCTLKGALPNL